VDWLINEQLFRIEINGLGSKPELRGIGRDRAKLKAKMAAKRDNMSRLGCPGSETGMAETVESGLWPVE